MKILQIDSLASTSGCRVIRIKESCYLHLVTGRNRRSHKLYENYSREGGRVSRITPHTLGVFFLGVTPDPIDFLLEFADMAYRLVLSLTW